MSPKQLISTYPIISEQVDRLELLTILESLNKQLIKQHGAVVEFGCYIGTTSLFLRRIMDVYGVSEFHVYDSFEGLPGKSDHDLSPAGEQFKAGELRASKKELLRHFHKANLTPPVIHKGWFSDVTSNDIPDGITFAFLDGDYYDSIIDSFKLIWPKMLPSAVIIVDDYANEALPGAARAVNELVSRYRLHLRTEQSLAIIQTMDRNH